MRKPRDPVATLEDLDLDGRTVFVRLDLNVPLQDGVITSEARIRAALPTIRFAMENGAHVAMASHLGRPKGKRKAEFSLEPVGVRLSELLDVDVRLADDCVGDGVATLMRELRSGTPVLLENLRFHPGESKNDSGFARKLAAPFDTYINDAFGACHRAHASIVGMVEGIEPKWRAAGFLLQNEIEAIGRLLDAPKDGFVAVVGGAKVADKIGVLSALLPRVDTLCIGGAMAYTFLKARGEDIGESRFEQDQLRVAREIVKGAEVRNVRLALPLDHVAAASFDADAEAKVLPTVSIAGGLLGLDIGPKTREQYAAHVKSAHTVFWNGPMGVFEWDSFAKGTRAIAAAVAECNGYTVVGGGDSVAALEASGAAADVDHVSTGGGASLELLEKETLPGIDCLRRPKEKEESE